MALSRLAQQFADEFRQHDWSDAHSRIDRAGHDRKTDRTTTAQMTGDERDHVLLNVVWNTGQVLAYNDANFNIVEFAVAAGVPRRLTHNSDGRPSGTMLAGLRTRDGKFAKPGTWDFEN